MMSSFGRMSLVATTCLPSPGESRTLNGKLLLLYVIFLRQYSEQAYVSPMLNSVFDGDEQRKHFSFMVFPLKQFQERFKYHKISSYFIIKIKCLLVKIC